MIKGVYYLGASIGVNVDMGNTLNKNVVIVSGLKANGVDTYCKIMSQHNTKVYVAVDTAHDVPPKLKPDVIQYIALLDLTKTMKGDNPDGV